MTMSPHNRTIWKAYLLMMWERVFVSLLYLGAAGAVFVAISWLGLWRHMPTPYLHGGVLAFFAAIACWQVGRLFLVRRPHRRDVLARIEADSGLCFQPLRRQDETFLATRANQHSTALWRAEQARLQTNLSRTTLKPRHQFAKLDPYYLRTPVVVLFFVAALVAHGEYLERLEQAFQFAQAAPLKPTTGAPINITGWIEPPAYTRRGVVYLALPIEEVNAPSPSIIDVPAHSRLLLHISGADKGLRVTFGGSTPLESKSQQGAIISFDHTLEDSGELNVVTDEGAHKNWHIKIRPDAPPTIRTTSNVHAPENAPFVVPFEASDDYGIEGFSFTLHPQNKDTYRAPLYEFPELSLPAPLLRNGIAEGEVKKNLLDHPLAGAQVLAELTVSDARGQKAHTRSVPFLLQMRSFSDPIAQEFASLSRLLARDKLSRITVQIALYKLMRANPDLHPSIQLGAIVAQKRLLSFKSRDDDLREVVALIWDLARAVDNKTLYDNLLSAQNALDALKQALDAKAPSKELEAKIDALRKALEQLMRQKMLEALADGKIDNLQQLGETRNSPSQQSLNNMLEALNRSLEQSQDGRAESLIAALEAMIAALESGELNLGIDGEGQGLSSGGQQRPLAPNGTTPTFEEGGNNFNAQGTMPKGSEATRARAIRDTLHQRLSNPQLDKTSRDYLEQLLEILQ